MVSGDGDGRATRRAVLQWNIRLAVADDRIQFPRFTQPDKTLSPHRMKLAAKIGLDDAQSVFGRHALAIGARAGHGIEGIADADNARIHADLIAGQTLRVCVKCGKRMMS